MKRYDPELYWAEYHGHAVRMEEVEDGDWVEYDDYKKLKDEYEELKNQLESKTFSIGFKKEDYLHKGDVFCLLAGTKVRSGSKDVILEEDTWYVSICFSWVTCIYGHTDSWEVIASPLINHKHDPNASTISFFQTGKEGVGVLDKKRRINL